MMSKISNLNDNRFPPVRRSKFFFEDSMVVIQIGDVQFRVHKSKLMESETFTDMFTVAKGSHSNFNASEKLIEGLSAEHPIKLEGVSASDFECLLTLLYERHYTAQHPKLDASLVVPAFRLAHMWNFKELAGYLLPYMKSGLDDVDKIVYAHEFGLKEWIIPAYISLYRRTEPLSSAEAEKIGFKGAMLVFRLREENHPVANQQCCGQTMMTYCDSCGNSPNTSTASRNRSDKVIEEKIKAWEKGGQIFKK
ncbi:unnamed protein product [Rhizoctonia solani]|uniref:BTB domain-containing protein n=1 Tax=Rhizoctonia solani TaxID=456999 RepID=A0A8H3B633_9AGAM|nr:unnamed protein product [Rhizoctonia solani]